MVIAGNSWNPVVGEETQAFLSAKVPEQSREGIQNSAVSILSKGIPPTQVSGQKTGLIVGYVQSGKTMSFETVIALARDNAFQIVIVIAGTSNPLLDQSNNRLQQDLGLDKADRARRWSQIQFPTSRNEDVTQAISDVLGDWRDATTPEEYKKTVLVTVLKHHVRLRTLTEIMSSIDLRGVPVLIIDDEADQASLNNEVAQGQESTTYRRLMELRQIFPNHTYLQYTATPQAPLLINIIDSLSPNFVQVLETGQNYVGGQEFFGDNADFVRVIPFSDVPSNTNPLTEPPESLLEALRIFMVGVTIGLIESHNKGNRSMLVHPSRTTIHHQEYVGWVMDIFEEWKRVLNLPDNDADRQELIEEFREAYTDLARTVSNILPFEQLARSFRLAFRHTLILEVNARSGTTPTVDWRNAYGWILVGGTAMDRGFTVEGLTVTYMPRGIGVGNADTIQQRARFFGYKRQYLGYCRIYLEQDTIEAYRNYVEHEEEMRRQLQGFQNSQRPLNEWKRNFILDTALRPCRKNVLDFDYVRGNFASYWVSPRVVLVAPNVIQMNRLVVDAFLRGKSFVEDDGDSRRKSHQRHQVCINVPLAQALEELLLKIRIIGSTDSQRHIGLLLQLSKALEENQNEVCSIYCISPNEQRRRDVNENGEITNIFQGAYPVQPAQRGEIYPGDMAIGRGENVSIQIHRIDLTKNRTESVANDVPVLAVWVPQRFAKGWIVQEQGQVFI